MKMCRPALCVLFRLVGCGPDGNRETGDMDKNQPARGLPLSFSMAQRSIHVVPGS